LPFTYLVTHLLDIEVRCSRRCTGKALRRYEHVRIRVPDGGTHGSEQRQSFDVTIGKKTKMNVMELVDLVGR
jgi:hypothetical protein